jgi:uncharacterized circularly permuted ATP-grasp superfamily protein/uncharacterized alpha-E superfamily protein
MNPNATAAGTAAAATGSPVAPSNPFPGYLPPETAYDELTGADGQPRRHWKRLVELLGSWHPTELADRWEQARRLIRDNGVTYNVHDDAAGEQRPWVLDPIPLVIAQTDWERLEVGINQRARALEALLADLYGPQHMLREGIVPPELVFGNPAFLRCCHGIVPPGGRWLHLHAVVVARNRDGKWMALGDRTGVPQGLGYALENRLVVSRLLPEVFQECHVERLAPFFIALRTLLRGLVPTRDAPRVALQSPGPTSATYFEDAYLARYLGFPLVEGGDLTVRDDKLALKTLGGLVQIDVLLRRVADRQCDPLELDGTALEGTPGLVQAVRQGRAILANPIGSGLVESPGFAEFLPAVSRRLLGEDLHLASPVSRWCGIPSNLDHVLNTLDDCVLESVVPRRGMKRFVPALLDSRSRTRLIDEVRAKPGEWVGRQRVERSVAPCWHEGEIAPASVLFRCFAVAAAGGSFQTMRGGLARMNVGRSAGEETLLSSQGSKDVWVLASGPVQPVTLLRQPGQPLLLRRSGYDLPSRVADDLFWLGRQAERAEGTARLLRTVVNRLASEANQDATIEATILMAALENPPDECKEWLDASRPGTLSEIQRAVVTLAYDAGQPGGVQEGIDRLWHTASVVRDRISIDSWNVLSRVRRDCLTGRPAQGSGGLARPGDMLPYLDTLIIDLAAFAGLGTESMTRGPGWRFLDMGRRVERATASVQLLSTALVPPRPTEAADAWQRLEEMLLEIADSSMTYRNRYLGMLEPAPLIDLLVIDETNPRSVAFQFAALAQHVEQLPSEAASPVLSGERRAVLEALSALRLADVGALAAAGPDGGRALLGELLGILATAAGEFSESITHRYLVHAVPQRRLGDPTAATPPA